MSADGVGGVEITPTPDDEEVAAILAAYEALWPKPVLLVDGPAAAPEGMRWRFSGRWWSKPVALRRDRPVTF